MECIIHIKVRQKLEDEKRALISFVTDIDNHISSGPSRLSKLMPPSSSSSSKLGVSTKANIPLSAIKPSRKRSLSLGGGVDDPANSPVKTELSRIRGQPSLLEQMPEEEWEGDEPSFRGCGQRVDDKENIPIR
jgi:centromeric protein E